MAQKRRFSGPMKICRQIELKQLDADGRWSIKNLKSIGFRKKTYWHGDKLKDDHTDMIISPKIARQGLKTQVPTSGKSPFSSYIFVHFFNGP